MSRLPYMINYAYYYDNILVRFWQENENDSFMRVMCNIVIFIIDLLTLH